MKAVLTTLNRYKGRDKIAPEEDIDLNVEYYDYYYGFFFDSVKIEDDKLILESSSPLRTLYIYSPGEDDADIYEYQALQEELDGDYVRFYAYSCDEDGKAIYKKAPISYSKNGKNWAFEYEDGEELPVSSLGIEDTPVRLIITHPKIKDIKEAEVIDLTEILKAALDEGKVNHSLKLEDVFRKSLYLYK